MDESLKELENELKALRPQRPSALLRARIERELAGNASPARRAYATATSWRSWKWAGWQAAVAVAGVVAALGLGLWQGRRDPAPGTAVAGAATADVTAAGAPEAADGARAQYVPVAAASVLYDLRDEGPVTLEDATSGRRARYRYVDTYTWRNPATNASLKLSVPRDEVRVLPVDFQ